MDGMDHMAIQHPQRTASSALPVTLQRTASSALPMTLQRTASSALPVTLQRYHDTNCCEAARNVDALLAHYRSDRERVIDLMESDPDELLRVIWTQNGPLARDNECRCRMGTGEIRSRFACAQCTHMRRLIDFRKGSVNRAFELECGEQAGTNLIVTATPVHTPYLAWDDAAAAKARKYLEQYQSLRTCGTPDISKMRCITGDSFTIGALVQWIVNHHFEYNGLEHLPLLYTAFICNDTGYSLYPAPTIGSLEQLHQHPQYHLEVSSPKAPEDAYPPLTTEVARTIIVQLLVILRELSEIQFVHGNSSVSSLIFTDSPVSYQYEDVVVQGPITVQITDLANSSVTFDNIHYYPSTVRTTMYVDKSMFAPEIATKRVSMAHCAREGIPVISVCAPDDVTLYRLTDATVNIYAALRHIGFPMFVGSFDLYCFMVSLMGDKSFRDAVMADTDLRRLWEMMWITEDLAAVQQQIEASTDIDPVRVIRGRWLRCDIVNLVWELIRTTL